MKVSLAILLLGIFLFHDLMIRWHCLGVILFGFRAFREVSAAALEDLLPEHHSIGDIIREMSAIRA